MNSETHSTSSGQASDKRHETREYRNNSTHPHGETPCANEFETSYAPDKPEIVYCEACCNSEIA